MARREVYVSVDIEADGPIPGPHSMLSLGAAGFWIDWSEVPRAVACGTFSVNLETLPGAEGDPETMKWWRSQPAAWDACRSELQAPADAMRRFVAWLGGVPGRPGFGAYPAAVRLPWGYWDLVRVSAAETVFPA